MLIEPRNGLDKSLLLSPPLNPDVHIAANCKAVGHAAEQVDLPWVTGLNEGVLGFMTELGGEDGVDFWILLVLWLFGLKVKEHTGSSNGQGALDSA